MKTATANRPQQDRLRSDACHAGNHRHGIGLSPRSVVWAVVASIAMAVFYVIVVRGASGAWSHLRDQTQSDWPYLVAIVVGFGIQVGLVVELRHRHRLNASAAAAGGAGTGASTAGMVACCAHHLADLIPFVSATGAAAFLTDYRVPFMLVGIGINAIGVTVAFGRLRHGDHFLHRTHIEAAE